MPVVLERTLPWTGVPLMTGRAVLYGGASALAPATNVKDASMTARSVPVATFERIEQEYLAKPISEHFVEAELVVLRFW